MSEFNRWGLSAGASLQNATGYFPEGQAPSTLNDGNRTIMAELRRDQQARNAEVTATHSDGAYTLTYERELTAGELGGIYTFIADTANSTSSATLAINGNAAKPLVTPDGALAASAIDAKSIVTVAYDPSNDVYQVLNTVRQSGAEITELTGSDSFQVITSTGLRASIQTINARLGLHPANSCYVEANLTTGISLDDNTAYTVGDSTMAFTEVEDVGGDFDAATGIFTAPAAGVYFCSYWATILVNAGNPTETWYVLLKEAVTAGTYIHRGFSVNASTFSGVNLSGGGAGVFTLNASDTLEIEVKHQTGTARTIGSTAGATGIQIMRIK